MIFTDWLDTEQLFNILPGTAVQPGLSWNISKRSKDGQELSSSFALLLSLMLLNSEAPCQSYSGMTDNYVIQGSL